MGKQSRLILLYGDVSPRHDGKYQWMIDGKCTCGYRPYAEKYGIIIYLTKQTVREPWEFSIINSSKVISFISKRPDAVVWSIKHGRIKDRQILSKISNKKIYYSCCAARMYNPYCDVSLVDTKSRLAKNAKLWMKGKDPAYWRPCGRKEFDYLLIGKRADKNEILFLQKLQSRVRDKRRVLWIGGHKHRDQVRSMRLKHHVEFIKFGISQKVVRDNIPKARVGILFTQHPREGFPQSFIEMTMSGVPVVYSNTGPRNKFYFFDENSVIANKGNLIEKSEYLLRHHDPEACRQCAIRNYSLEVSAHHLLDLVK